MKYFLSIVAIFKNEGHSINEWIEHYILEGVDHFYLIDNDSTDGYIINLEYHPLITLVYDNKKHSQIDLLNKHFLEKIKEESEWIINIDLDEFMYSRKGFNTIANYLNTVDYNITQIGVPWKMFGSSGYVHQPDSIIKHFVYRCSYPKYTAIKTLTRTDNLIRLLIHSQATTNNEIFFTNNTFVNIPLINNIFIDEKILEDSCLHINHYPIQSFEFFKNVKMTRGAADMKVNVRNIQYFNEYDMFSDTLDEELKHKNKIVEFSCFNPDIKLYGNSVYIDVTDNPLLYKLFGYPVPGSKKYYIVRNNHKLTIYEEY